MVHNIHLSEQYQDFLISEQRKGLIPPDLYDVLVSYKEGINILDFGCGLGYTASYYSEKFSGELDFHIYACDYQVEILDLFWKRIAENKFKNITAFFMPDRSRVHVPAWIPRVNYLMLSLVLSTVDNPVDLLKTVKPIIVENGRVNIIDWDRDKMHEELDGIYPIKYRLKVDHVEDYLEKAGYKILKVYRTSGPYFALTAEPEATGTRRYTEMEAHQAKGEAKKEEERKAAYDNSPGGKVPDGGPDGNPVIADEDLSRAHIDARNEDEFK